MSDILSENKQAIESAALECKTLGKQASAKLVAFEKAQKKADANPKKVKLADAAAALKAELDAAIAQLVPVYERYKSINGDINAGYEKAIAEASKREAGKLKKQQDKYNAAQSKVSAKLDDMMAPFAPYIPAPAEEPVEEAIEEEVFEQEPTVQYSNYNQGYYNPYNPYAAPQPQNVNIAPVSIDITPMVENALKAAMAKFTKALDSRVNAYVENLPAVTPIAGADAPVAAPVSSQTVAMADKVADDEKFVLDKLVTLLENLKEATEKLGELSASYAAIADKQKEAVDSARRVNDMQRALSRELKGVQANQKVVTQDQVAVTEEQTVVLEHQKAVIERQKQLTEEQVALGDVQRAVIETQAELEKNMQDLVRKQKNIAAKQQALAESLEKPKQAKKSETLAEKAEEIVNAVEYDESGKDKLAELAVEEEAKA